MATIAFKKGLLANLPSTHKEGTFYVTTDERAMYLDISDTTRVRLGDFQEFATVAELEANSNPSTSALYYVTAINCLAKWDGTKYVQINLDTGATSVETTGGGNALTGVSYNAATRKLTFTADKTFLEIDGVNAAIDAKVGTLVDGDNTYTTVKEYVDAKTAGIATETALTQLSDRVEDLEEDTHTHENKAVLDGITDAKVSAWDAAEQNAKEYADELAANYDASGAASTVQKNLDGEIARAKAAEAEALAEAQAKVASVTAGDKSVTVGGTSKAPTVAVKLNPDADNAIKLTEDGLKVEIGAAPEYTIVKAEDSGDFAAVYNLTKDGVNVGTSINIPKDMVVQSGSVVTDPDGKDKGTYIKLVLQNVDEPLYIDVGSLIEYVTSGSQSDDMVVISISDDHKVTASVTDGAITLTKLSTDVQTAIGKAHEHENKDILDDITADDVAAWRVAEQNAKDYADGKDAAIAAAQDAADKAQDDIDALQALVGQLPTDESGAAVASSVVDYVNQKTEGIASDLALENLKTELEEKIESDDATTLASAKAYADGLAGNYDADGAADEALTSAKAYTDEKIAAVDVVTTWVDF